MFRERQQASEEPRSVSNRARKQTTKVSRQTIEKLHGGNNRRFEQQKTDTNVIGLHRKEAVGKDGVRWTTRNVRGNVTQTDQETVATHAYEGPKQEGAGAIMLSVVVAVRKEGRVGWVQGCRTYNNDTLTSREGPLRPRSRAKGQRDRSRDHSCLCGKTGTGERDVVGERARTNKTAREKNDASYMARSARVERVCAQARE